VAFEPTAPLHLASQRLEPQVAALKATICPPHPPTHSVQMFQFVFYVNSFLLSLATFAFWQKHASDVSFLPAALPARIHSTPFKCFLPCSSTPPALNCNTPG
jgi:hypothetical protein